MSKLLFTLSMILSLSCGPVVMATELGILDVDTGFSRLASPPQVKLSVQPYSIKDMSSLQTMGSKQPVLSTLSVSKTWNQDSEWKLYSTHHIQGSAEFFHPAIDDIPQLSLDHSARGFSMNNRLSLRKRYSNSLILTPAIGLNILSTQGATLSNSSTLFYPLPLALQNHEADLYSLHTGVDLNGLFTENWGYRADLEYAYLLNTNGAYAWKSEASLFYQWHANSRILVGYKYINGSDANVHNTQLYPVVDFLWSW